MIALRKISEETLAKASVLTHQQMSKVVGGGCWVRCDQNESVENPDDMPSVPNCNREYVEKICPGGLQDAICGGSSGC